MPEFQCSAILFDLDGVLVDSTQAIVSVWTAWANQRSLDPARVLEVIHGRRTLEALQLLAPDPSNEAEVVELEKAVSYDPAGIMAVPGAARLLESISPERWCVVTSGMGDYARVRLQAAGLPLPRALVAADDVAEGKPHPEPYLKGAQLLGVSPEECLVFEDALNGIRAAHAAGMKVIGVATTFSVPELSEAEAVVETLERISVTGDIKVKIERRLALATEKQGIVLKPSSASE